MIIKILLLHTFSSISLTELMPEVDEAGRKYDGREDNENFYHALLNLQVHFLISFHLLFLFSLRIHEASMFIHLMTRFKNIFKANLILEFCCEAKFFKKYLIISDKAEVHQMNLNNYLR